MATHSQTTQTIAELLKVDMETAQKVEDIMRDEYRTLDYISKAEFNRAAKRALVLLPEIEKQVEQYRKENPR